MKGNISSHGILSKCTDLFFHVNCHRIFMKKNLIECSWEDRSIVGQGDLRGRESPVSSQNIFLVPESLTHSYNTKRKKYICIQAEPPADLNPFDDSKHSSRHQK